MITAMERLPPSGDGWRQLPRPPPTPATVSISAWKKGSVTVISELGQAELPDRSGIGPTWLVSVTSNGARPAPRELRRALRAFGMLSAEEDNHHPGVARHFFLVVDPAHRVECECKDSEATIVEPDGYRWSNPKDAECRGCELARLIPERSCPLHSNTERTA